MHICKLGDVLSEDEQRFLGETVEAALEEAREVLKAHENEPPLLFDIQTIGEAAQDYLGLVHTQKERIKALERIQFLLENR